MLSPLMVQPGVEAGVAPVAKLQKQHSPQESQSQHQQQQQQPKQQADGQTAGHEQQDASVFGWQLRLVMQWCDKVGSVNCRMHEGLA
jgi:hypothetical protein